MFISFFKTADPLAVHQSEGKTAGFNDHWKMSQSAGARVSAQFFRMTYFVRIDGFE